MVSAVHSSQNTANYDSNQNSSISHAQEAHGMKRVKTEICLSLEWLGKTAIHVGDEIQCTKPSIIMKIADNM